MLPETTSTVMTPRRRVSRTYFTIMGYERAFFRLNIDKYIFHNFFGSFFQHFRFSDMFSLCCRKATTPRIFFKLRA